MSEITLKLTKEQVDLLCGVFYKEYLEVIDFNSAYDGEYNEQLDEMDDVINTITVQLKDVGVEFNTDYEGV